MTLRLVFDIETDGLLDTLTKIHCIALIDADNPDKKWLFGPDEIKQGLELLVSADEVIGHNIINFDIPAIKKLTNINFVGIKVTDTLVLSRLIKANLANDDYKHRWAIINLPKNLFGSHSLKAWGYRLEERKGIFGHDGDWSTYTEDMGKYCLQDVVLNHKLWEALASQKWSQESIKFEHEMAELCHRIGRAGWTLDVTKAGKLYASLIQERTDIDAELQELFPPWIVETPFLPKVNNSKLGYVKGETFIKKEEVAFNPNSRKHIAFCLRQKYDWKPKHHTITGDPIVDEAVLSELKYPEAKKLAHSFLLQKRIGMLAEGKNAWLKLADGNVIRHTIVPNGAVTGRATHSSPNLAQVPSNRAPYGKQCRELFTVPDGYSLVGSDLSGLELRCLAHFLNDEGAYAYEILNGDIHTSNQQAAGLATRDQAKTFIYALIYGAGDAKIGSVVGGGNAEGRQLRDRFLNANPAFKDLVRHVKQAASRGFLIGLDGRKLYVRSEHAALNTLLQSAGALICKKWALLTDQALKADGLDAQIISWVHDELNLRVKKGQEKDVCNRLQQSAKASGEAFSFKIPIDSEYHVGKNWSDVH